MYNIMLVCILWMKLALSTNGEIIQNHVGNMSHPDKDMYVIHATVYEVGILTNKTDNRTSNLNTTGTQESVTFFQNNGTSMDLSRIPEPLLTNVTAQSMVGVAPVGKRSQNVGAWGMLGRSSVPKNDQSVMTNVADSKVASIDSTKFLKKLFRRDINSITPVKVVKGTAVIPPALGLQSISLPPLLSLNNKLSGIPVPIPNTAVVNYAKVNTLVRKS